MIDVRGVEKKAYSLSPRITIASSDVAFGVQDLRILPDYGRRILNNDILA